jgi:serine/threonine-protein kinase
MSEPFGRYRIEKELGRGAMGVVYQAFDTVLERDVAIKTISSSIRDDNLRERFIREARAAGKLLHPNIITIYDFGVQGSQLYISMELAEGSDLFDLISRRPPLDIRKRLEIVRQICLGLDFAHAHGVYHRDVKPANIRLDQKLQVKIVDFGLAIIQTSSLTQSNAILGTPSYIAPERLLGGNSDAASDQFAVGIILFELLTYAKAFTGENLSLVIHNILHSEPPRLDEAFTKAYPRLDETLRRAIRKNPRLRFATLGEMAAELESVMHQMTDDGFQLTGPIPIGETQGSTEWLSDPRKTPVPATLPEEGDLTHATIRRKKPWIPWLILSLAALGAIGLWLGISGGLAAKAKGTLLFDIRPYARILSVRAIEDNREIDLPAESERLTPLRLDLPPGRYRIEYDHPDWKGVFRTLETTVSAVGFARLSEPVDENFVEAAADHHALSLDFLSEET